MMFSKSRFCRMSVMTAFAVASATFTSSGAFAAVQCGASAISIPANIDGVYMNIATGATGTAGSGVAGWDINLYQTGASALYFFWPSTPATSSGGLADGSGTVYASLASGAAVDASGTYIVSSGGGGPAPFVNWQTASTGKYLGVRFFNEATSSINYAWLQINTGASGGFPATINSYCFENGGTGISTGTTPVTLQNYSVD